MFAQPAFVGRSSELAALSARWEQARAGGPAVVLVRGPAGIGKTALVRRFLATADVRSTAWATGDELEQRLPLGVVAQLASGLSGAMPGSDPLAVGAQLVRRLGELQRDGPAAVVVDDAHWADATSLQALGFACRRLQAERLAVVVICRVGPDVGPHAVPDALYRLATSPNGAVVDVTGLGLTELAALADSLGHQIMSQRVLHRLQHHTGGNPLYAASFLQELGTATLQDPTTSLPAPQAFRIGVLAQLGGTPAATEQLVAAAAVLGQRTPLATAGEVGEVADPARALEPAVAAGLLEMVEVRSDTIGFTHPLVRAAVYHDLPVARRCGLHGRAADVSTGAARLEHRAAATVGTEAELAAELVAHARTEADAGAWEAAASHLDTAVRLEPDPDHRDRLRLDAVDLLVRGGETAAATARRDDIARLPASPRRHATLGHLALVAGRQGDAERLLARAWQDADPAEDRELAAASAAQLSQLCLAQARGAESEQWAQRALEAGPADAFTRGVARSVLVAAMAVQGRGDEALALLDHLPRGVSDLDAEEIEGVMGRGVVQLWAGAFQPARQDLTTIASLRTGWRPLRVRVISLAHLAVAEFELGAWDDSVAHADLAVSLTRDADFVWILPLAHYSASLVLAGRGQFEAAAGHVEAARTASVLLGDASGVGYAATAGAWLAHCRGDHSAVTTAVKPALTLPHRDGIDEPGVLAWRPLQAEALVAADELDKAAAAIGPFEQRTAQRSHQVAAADAARIRGLLAAATGAPDLARTAFDDAQCVLAGTTAPVQQARLDESYGRFLRRAGERRRAAELLQRARTTYERLGAEPFLARCERELAACGLTPGRRDPARQHRLTPQELAVARAVAGGLTNREVAQELVISVKTVEYHLSNIYAKLGLRSRTQLAARMART